MTADSCNEDSESADQKKTEPVLIFRAFSINTDPEPGGGSLDFACRPKASSRAERHARQALALRRLLLTVFPFASTNAQSCRPTSRRNASLVKAHADTSFSMRRKKWGHMSR